MLPLNATYRYAATGGIPDALLSCHRYDEILPPGATQSCHLNGSGLDRQIQRSAAEWRLRSELARVSCCLPVNRPELRNPEISLPAMFAECIGNYALIEFPQLGFV